jgi:hypothetical protein
VQARTISSVLEQKRIPHFVLVHFVLVGRARVFLQRNLCRLWDCSQIVDASRKLCRDFLKKIFSGA